MQKRLRAGSGIFAFKWMCRCAAALSLLAASNAMAADAAAAAPQIKRTVVERREIAGTDQEMQMILVEFPPGAISTPHHHPEAGLVYILEGTAESAYGTEAPKTYHAGDVMQDIPDVPHTLFRNPDHDHPLRFLIFANLHKGQPYLVIP